MSAPHKKASLAEPSINLLRTEYGPPLPPGYLNRWLLTRRAICLCRRATPTSTTSRSTGPARSINLLQTEYELPLPPDWTFQLPWPLTVRAICLSRASAPQKKATLAEPSINSLRPECEAPLWPGLVHLLWPLTARAICLRRMVATFLNSLRTECEASLP